MIHGPAIDGKGGVARKPRAMRPARFIRSEPAIAQFVRRAEFTACLNMTFNAVVMSAGVLAV